MAGLATLIREILESGEDIGKSAAEKCPRCGWEMALFRKHSWLDLYFWTCDGCDISIPTEKE